MPKSIDAHSLNVLEQKGILPTPWDRAVFGFKTYEIQTVTQEVLEAVQNLPGHFTVKVSSLSSKKLLDQYGFYYCDTLIEPYCDKKNFISHEDNRISLSKEVDVESLVRLTHGSFIGRFHRDFNVDPERADARYDQWLRQLDREGKVTSLLYSQELAGFFASLDNHIVLHALGESFRNRGLAKFFWTPACLELFSKGFEEITSSVSISNARALNLYLSLGFKLRRPLDVYHRWVSSQ